MPTTRHKAGFETGTHSRSPLQGAITRGALHVSQRVKQGRPRYSQQGERSWHRASMSAVLQPSREKRALMTPSLSVSVSTTPLRVVKKRSRDALCRSWGPKNLRRQSEIDTGSLALTAQVRSGRDHSEREHVDHRNGSKHPEKGSGVLSSCPCPVDVAHCRALGTKGRP